MHVKYFYIGMRKTYVKSYIKFSGIVFKKRINIFNILSWRIENKNINTCLWIF